MQATGYDFELDMLVSCRETARPVREVGISTIYIDNNRSSHFNPLRDSMRIYFVFVRFLAASLTARESTIWCSSWRCTGGGRHCSAS